MVKAYVEVSGDNIETSPSLYTYFDQNRYLFECGEGTQRSFTQRYGINFTKLTNILISTLRWESLGGLLGLTYTIDDIGIKEINLYGPKGLHQLFTASKYFSGNHNLRILIHELPNVDNYTIRDPEFTIVSVPINKATPKRPSSYRLYRQENRNLYTVINNDAQSPPGSPPLQPQPTSSSSDPCCNEEPSKTAFSLFENKPQQQNVHDVVETEANNTESTSVLGNNIDSKPLIKKLKRDSSNKNKLLDQYPLTGSGGPIDMKADTILCWICSTNDFVGRFHPEKAVELGIPQSQAFLYKRLKNGETITLPNGTQVFPHQVMDEPSPATNFAIIRCPTEEYFDTLFNNEAFKPYFNNSLGMKFMFHIAPPTILNSSRYIEFMEKFKDTKHIIINDVNCEYNPSFPSSERLTSKLSQMAPDLFPGPIPMRPVKPLFEPGNLSIHSEALKKNITPIEKMIRVVLGPARQAGEIEQVPQVSKQEEEANPMIETSPHRKSLEEATKACNNSENKLLYPKVLFTGTGSAMPSPYRNVTGNHILMENGTNMLLDCGEGTYGQLARFYGPEKIEEILLNLKAIWISHVHADHHLGLPRILEKRAKLIEEKGINADPIVVIGPFQLVLWLKRLKRMTPLHFEGIEFENIQESTHAINALRKLGIVSLESVPVIHCSNACGIVIELESGVKFTFSGDTRPCSDLAKAGINSTFLLHEATFGDDMVDEAKAKKHSTIGEALSIGKEMNAKFTLLTHFSQRYSKMPDITHGAFGLAFDLLQVSPYQFPMLSHLSKLFESTLVTKKKEEPLVEIPKKKIRVGFKNVSPLDQNQNQNKAVEMSSNTRSKSFHTKSIPTQSPKPTIPSHFAKKNRVQFPRHTSNGDKRLYSTAVYNSQHHNSLPINNIHPISYKQSTNSLLLSLFSKSLKFSK